MNPDSPLKRGLNMMLQVAKPLDEWCALCEERLATMTSADGVGACEPCAEQFILKSQGVNREWRREEERREKARRRRDAKKRDRR